MGSPDDSMVYLDVYSSRVTPCAIFLKKKGSGVVEIIFTRSSF